MKFSKALRARLLAGALAGAAVIAQCGPADAASDMCPAAALLAQTKPDSHVFTALEPITAGAIVSFTAGGVRNASSADFERPGEGFVECGVKAGQKVRVFGPGETIDVLGGLKPGHRYYLAVAAGGITTDVDAPSQFWQYIGTAITAETLHFLPSQENGR